MFFETLACTTCDAALQARIFGDDFLRVLLMVTVPLLVGGLLVVWLTHRVMAARDARSPEQPALAPTVAAGTLLGLGLGGFLDGIVLHQLLQWHQMLSSWVPPDTVEAKNLDMFWDGVFHLGAWTLTVLGVVLLWRLVGRPGVARSRPALLGAWLFGWGAFNVVDGTVNHHLFRFHAVRELAERPWAWNLGFLVLGLAQVALGLVLVRAARRYGTATM
jgi:uncharacterized membrane protein